jgi:hypothetical protein
VEELSSVSDASVLSKSSAIFRETPSIEFSSMLNNSLFSYFKTDRLNVKPVKEIIRTLNTFWQNERYGNKTKTKGIIISIHHNGKGGRIKDSNGIVLGFMKKDLVRKLKSIDNIKGASVEQAEVGQSPTFLGLPCPNGDYGIL